MRADARPTTRLAALENAIDDRPRYMFGLRRRFLTRDHNISPSLPNARRSRNKLSIDVVVGQ
jgi:hypothetical protein